MKSRMTAEEYRQRYPDRPEPVATELLGKWLAWDSTGTRIIAHADTLPELVDEVNRLGIEQPVYHKVPRGSFIGAGCR